MRNKAADNYQNTYCILMCTAAIGNKGNGDEKSYNLKYS